MKKILVADDDIACRTLVVEVLKNLPDVEITAVQGGEEAFQEIQKGAEFALLITDLRMRTGTGIELLRRIRRLRMQGKPVPQKVIVTTALLDGGEDYLKSLDVDEIFLKPIEMEPFLACAKKLL